MAGSLLDEIERDALDDSVPLPTALRKCIALGGRSGSEALRNWATRELQGYYSDDDDADDDLPPYRTIVAPLRLDGIAGHYKITGESLAPSTLPDVVQEHITETLELRQGVGELAAFLDQADIKLMPRAGADIVRLMNAERNDPHRFVHSIYWHVSHATVRGVLDQVRTALLQLVSEIRANTSPVEDVPPAEAADQAVSLIMTGKRARATVTVAQATGGSTATSTVNQPVPEAEAGWWARWRRPGAFVVGAATIAGTMIALIALID